MTQKDRDADIAFIEALARLLHDNDLAEIEVTRDYAEDDALSVRVTRTRAAPPPAAAVATEARQPAYMPAPEQPAPESAGAMPVLPSDPAAHPGAVNSPMVGTVYLQSEPGTAAFVSIGDAVEEGQTLLIVEAMKTMNQIPAPRAGVVRRILVEDGAPVEYGAPLMILE